MSLLRRLFIWDSAGNDRGANVNASNELTVKDTDTLAKLTDIETNQTDKSQYTRLTDGTNNVDVKTYEGESSASVAIAHKQTFHIHLDAQNISATQGFMLIDLSDTSNWPHTETDHIVLDQVIANTNVSATPAFNGEIEFGFLSNVDGTDGDFHVIGKFHIDRGGSVAGGGYDFSVYGMDLELDKWFGPTTANDTTWQTDVNLQGPDGATSYPSGAGDFVMKIIVTAGSIDVGMTVFYTTRGA